MGKAAAWLLALRLQFYPMTWLAYTLGALGAVAVSGSGNPGAYWLGYAIAFLMEAATVFSNDLFDYPSDRRNAAYGRFNGGSRVLVNGLLSRRELAVGMGLAVTAGLVLTGLLTVLFDTSMAVPVLFVILLLLGPGYTTPPLKLAWRGWGELDVALTHSTAAILCGYVVQGGAWNEPFPWLVSVPMFLAILPSILLAGLPDLEADCAAGKNTLVVRLGRRPTAGLAIVATLLAPLAVAVLRNQASLRGAFEGLLPWTVAHAAILVFLISRYWRTPVSGKIDGLLIVALLYLLWFVAFPVVRLL